MITSHHNGRLKTLAIAIFLVMLITIADRCKAQAVHIAISDGAVSITEKHIFLRYKGKTITFTRISHGHYNGSQYYRTSTGWVIIDQHNVSIEHNYKWQRFKRALHE